MRFRRTIPLIAVGALAIAACSSSTDTAGTSDTTTTSVESPSQTAATSETTASTASTIESGTVESTGTTTVTDTSAPDGTATTTDPIDVDAPIAALELAADTVSGEPYEIEFDDHDGADAWEISLAADGTTVTVWVSIDGTQVVDQEREDEPDDDVELLKMAEVSAVDALQTIAPLFSGTFDELELDTRDGDVVWEIEIARPGGCDRSDRPCDRDDGSHHDIIVDAVTGAVLDASDDAWTGHHEEGGHHGGTSVAPSDLDGYAEYERIVQEVPEIGDLVAIVETDNPNTRVIIFSEDGSRRPSYKSVFVREQNRLKLIAVGGGGVLVDETL